MAAGSWTLTNAGRTSLEDGTFRIGTDVFNMALFLSTSNIGAASTTYAALTNEVANAPSTTGYTTGGQVVTLALSGTTTVNTSASSVVWTAISASLTARFAVIYEVSGNVLAYCLLESVGPADVTATAGNPLTVTSGSGLWNLA